MLQFSEPKPASSTTKVTNESSCNEDSHSKRPMKGHQAVHNKNPDAICAVCKVDFNIERLSLNNAEDAKRILKESKNGMMTHLSTCTKCHIVCHPTIPKKRRKIHSVDLFQGLTCFQIAHTIQGFQIWRRNWEKSDASAKNVRSYNPQMKHELCSKVRELYGLPATQARKRKRSDTSQQNSSVNDSSSEDE
jgi:hypothetical protein